MAAASLCGVGETGETAELMETISLFSWLDEDWTMVSEASSAFYETSPVNTMERNIIEIQGSRRSRIRAFFKRAQKAIKKPFLCCRKTRVESQTPQENPHPAYPEPVPGPSGLQNTTDAGLSSVPAATNYESNSGETEQAAAWLETISFCCNFCPWLDEPWTKLSEASTPLHKASHDSTVERNTTDTQGSRRSKIHGFFKRAWKAIKKPFLCCRQTRVEPQTPQENPHLTDPEPEPVPELEPDFETEPDTDPEPVPGASNCEPNSGSMTNLYRLEKELGYGAFGEVFMAVRYSDGKEVAIKTIRKRGCERYIMIPGCSRFLFKEAALMLLLRRPPVSPYVIEMFEWFDQPDNSSLVMEYPQPCLSLLEYISRNGLLSEEVARCLMRQLVLALQNCLEHGIVHNDVHYNNILVNTKTLEVKLIDFGCAFQVRRDEHESIMPGLLSDLGMLLYFMLSGDPVDEELESCISLIPSVSPECCNLMDEYLKPDSECKTLDQILQHPWFGDSSSH